MSPVFSAVLKLFLSAGMRWVVFHCVCLSLVWLRSDGAKLINDFVRNQKKLKLRCGRTKRQTLLGSNPFAMSVLTNLRSVGREILHGFPTSIWPSDVEKCSHVLFTIIRITARFCISAGAFVESSRNSASSGVWRASRCSSVVPSSQCFSVRPDLSVIGSWQYCTRLSVWEGAYSSHTYIYYRNSEK